MFARVSAVAAVAALAAAQGPETAVIKPGQPFYDTDGNRVYAGGANMYLVSIMQAAGVLLLNVAVNSVLVRATG